MAGVFLVNVLDVARALGSEPAKATAELVGEWLLLEYLKKRGGGFNYNPAINATFDLFRGVLSPEEAVRHCLTTGNPRGRRQNAEVIHQIAPYALENVSVCHRIGFTAVSVGRVKARTVYVGIKAPMVRVVPDQAFVVLPGFRMSHRPLDPEIDVACSIALANFARDDFAAADFEYLYAGPAPTSRDRIFRSIKGRDRYIYSRDAVDSLLDIYVKGVAYAVEAGADVHEPNLKGYRIIDPREPSFF